MKTEIIFILDKSGSMGSIRNDAIGGFNTFLQDQQNLEGEANLTLVLFDTSYKVVYSSKDIKEVEPLNHEVYVPHGGTALLDSIGSSLVNLIEKEEEPKQVIVAILTDGEENSSREYSKKQVMTLIKALQKFGKFEFLFLGANQDAIQEASTFGIKSSNAVTFQASSMGLDSTFKSISKATSFYRSNATLDGFNIGSEYQKDLEENKS